MPEVATEAVGYARVGVSSAAISGTGGTVYYTFSTQGPFTTSNWESTRVLDTYLTLHTAVPVQWGMPATRPQGLGAEEVARRQAELEARVAERVRTETERAERRHQAQLRAEELLCSYLDEAQRERYADDEVFEVRGSLGGLYRIHAGTSGNVRLLWRGREVAGLCAHPDLDVRDENGHYLGNLPDADVMLGQMLALTTDEAGFHEVANVHWARDGTNEALAHLTRHLREAPVAS